MPKRNRSRGADLQAKEMIARRRIDPLDRLEALGLLHVHTHAHTHARTHKKTRKKTRLTGTRARSGDVRACSPGSMRESGRA